VFCNLSREHSVENLSYFGICRELPPAFFEIMFVDCRGENDDWIP
jgi:hypothetical protein